MLIAGREIAPRTPLEARQLGVAMVFQENSLVPSMTVAQNLFLGQEKFYNRLRGIYIAAQQFLQSLNFDVTPTATVAQARRRQETDGRDSPAPCCTKPR
jgi:simple sugar transport system ATP-binding protein